MAEIWARYALKAIVHVVETGASSITVRQDAFEAFNRALDLQNKTVLWESHGKGFYYLTESGRSVVNTPWRNADVRKMLLEPDYCEYEVR